MSRAPAGEGGERRPRRGFLGAAAVTGGAVLLGGCGRHDSLKTQLKQEPPVAEADVALLNHLLDLEYRAVAAYSAGGPLLSPAGAQAAKQFLAQELAHASGLSILVREAGGIADKPKPTYDFGNPRTSEDVLRLLHSIEAEQLAAYVDAIPKLQPEKVRTLTAQYFANDAQHMSIVRSLLHESPVPAAFASGHE